MWEGAVIDLSDLILTIGVPFYTDNDYVTFLLSFMQVFGEFQIWLAAENGMYLRHTSGEWTPTMEHLNMDWKESVQVEVLPDM